MKSRHIRLLIAALALLACFAPFGGEVKSAAQGLLRRAGGAKTVADRLAEHGDAARARLRPAFDRESLGYPPNALRLVGLKQERVLQVWAAGSESVFKHLVTYPLLAESGTLGPKLAEGDRQIPEGLYQIESLNPNSLYHLSLRLNYPNAFDRKNGVADGRTRLGSDIMIHGKAASVGCLAIGDRAIEDLFVLAADTGIENIEVILSPVDFRARALPPDMPPTPPWTPALYARIREQLSHLRSQTATSTANP